MVGFVSMIMSSVCEIPAATVPCHGQVLNALYTSAWIKTVGGLLMRREWEIDCRAFSIYDSPVGWTAFVAVVHYLTVCLWHDQLFWLG